MTLRHHSPPRSAIARVTAILATFRTGSAHSVTELARLTGLPVSTTHRMAHELAAHGLLYRRTDAAYEVGPVLRGLGEGSWSFSTLQQTGPRLLTDLSNATEHRTRLGVLVEGRVAYIEKRYGNEPPTTFSRGATLPAHATALGKALLAFAPCATLTRVARPLTTFTPRTLKSFDELNRALRIIRTTGLAVSLGEHFADEVTMALPIFAPDGAVAAALEVEVTESRSDFQLCRATLAVAAGAMTRELGTTTASDPPVKMRSVGG
jgi:DNA-binding IclR family transcriptional regulator